MNRMGCFYSKSAVAKKQELDDSLINSTVASPTTIPSTVTEVTVAVIPDISRTEDTVIINVAPLIEKDPQPIPVSPIEDYKIMTGQLERLEHVV